MAIIGSGIAAVTLAESLSERFAQTDIYVKENKRFPQREAHHRYVHPTMNSWPVSNLDATTQLPFMNWYAGRASDVIERLEQEAFSAFENQAVQILYNAEVVSLREISSGSVEVLIREESNSRQVEAYSCVIVADLGFDAERSRSRWSYWDPVPFAHDPCVRVVITGTGDGGLIEALRFSMPNESVEKLSIKLADLLTGSVMAQQIETAEQSSDGTSKSEHELFEFYLKKARELDNDESYSVVKGLLEQMLSKEKIVILNNGSGIFHFACNASPILKLMAAYASITGRAGLAKRNSNGNLTDIDSDEIMETHLSYEVIRTDRALTNIDTYFDLKFEPVGPDYFMKADTQEPASVSEKSPLKSINLKEASRQHRLAEEYVNEEYGAYLSIDEDGYVAYFQADDPEGRLPNHIFGIPMRFDSVQNVPELSQDVSRTKSKSRPRIRVDKTVGFKERVTEQTLVSARVDRAICQINECLTSALLGQIWGFE